TAWATVTVGDQNPELLVSAAILPTHVHVGDVITGDAEVMNTTDHRLRVRFTFEFDQPTRGVGGYGEAVLGPRESVRLRFHHRVRDRDAGGSYLLIMRAWDKHGASHTRAHASVS